MRFLIAIGALTLALSAAAPASAQYDDQREYSAAIAIVSRAGMTRIMDTGTDGDAVMRNVSAVTRGEWTSGRVIVPSHRLSGLEARWESPESSE